MSSRVAVGGLILNSVFVVDTCILLRRSALDKEFDNKIFT